MSLLRSFSLLRGVVRPSVVGSHLLSPVVSHQKAVVRGFASKKHKNLLKHAKGFRGRSKNCFRIAIRRVHKAWQYAYRDRRRKKREWRKLWIMRLQAAVRQYHWRYSEFIPAAQKSHVHLNRKVLSELAANEPFAFKSVLDVIEHQTGIKKRAVSSPETVMS